MGRVIKVRSGPSIPGQNTKMTFKMTKLVKPIEEVECPECKVAVEGLFWQNAETGEFDSVEDIMEYIEEEGEGPA